jgi:hypothetical protein
MRRRSLFLAVVVLLTVSIGPGAILADGTPPAITTIAQDESLTLFAFTFDEYNEIPWDQNGDDAPDPYEATVTAYVVAGTFAFYAEDAVIKLPLDSDCLEIQTAAEDGGEWFYTPDTPAPSLRCVDNCTDICTLQPIDDPLEAVILREGSVVFVPADTPCFVCAIGAGAASLDVTVRTEDADNIWARVAIPPVGATPGAGPEATPNAVRLGKLPMRNPGGCAGRV